MATLVRMKPYRVVISVSPSKARQDQGIGGLRELTAFIMAAPRGSPLRLCKLAPDHEDDFPMLHVERIQSTLTYAYRLQFSVLADANTDAAVAELYEVFAKNGWERR